MSYGGYNGPRHGGGGRRRGGGGGGGGPRHHHPPPERPEVKIKRAIIKFGDSDDPTPVDELSRAAEYLRDKLPADASAVAQGFKIGICEEPHKIPYYATLLAIVSSGTQQEDSSVSGAANLTRPVLEDLFRAFQASLDALAWRDIRFFTLFFAHLTNLGMINTASIIALLQSFTAVLDEPGVSQSRATNASRCIGEGLIRAGSVLHSSHGDAVADLVNAVRTYHSSVSDATRALFHPLPSIILSSTPAQSEKAHELLSSLLTSLDLLAQDNWALPVCIPQPETESSVIPQILRLATEDRMDVPSVLVPPEVEGEEKVGEETGVEWWIRMYDDELTPSPATPLGYTLRTLFIDMINIYEVNRKEGARILMEVHRWLSIGTFRPADDREATGIVLQNCLIEAVLSQLFHPPRSTLKLMYHAALINELCKLSPQTVGPAVGKSFRKMYSLLASPEPVEDGAAGLDVQLAHLFAEWFALHMSNFGFAWVWKEWVPDLELPTYHPKRELMRRVVDYEIRLAYYDRIAKTLPGPMAEPEAGVLPAQPPGPAYAYETPDHPHYQEAADLLAMIKGRAKSDEVAAHCLQLPRSVPLQHMVMQSLLQVGSRSFSHFLNAVERYLPLLRGEAGSGASTGGEKDKDKARAILCAAGEYWARNSQMIGIVFDKLMQYQIVEPSDVIEYAFAVGGDEGTGLNAERWGLVEAALNKANGRVVGAKRKVNTLNKDEEERRARAIANAGGMGMDADGDGDTQLAEPDMPASQSLVTAQKALEALLKDQKKVFQSAITGFVGTLTKAGIPSLAPAGEWSQKEWGAWETWGWYRQFCRAYVPQLRMFSDAFEVDRGADVGSLMAKAWDTALGYET